MSTTLKRILMSSASVALLIPTISFAATRMNLADFIALIMSYLNQVLFLIMGVAVVMFVFYVVKYFMKPGTDRAEAGQYVMYSVIGFFIVLSFWGLVNILQNTFGLRNENNNPGSWGSFQSLFPNGSGGSVRNSGSGVFQADLRLQVNSGQPDHYLYSNGTMQAVDAYGNPIK